MRTISILPFCGLILLCSTLSGYSQRTIRGDGIDYTENRNLPVFDQLHNTTSAEVILVKGDSSGVVIEGDKNVVGALETEVKGGELKIHFPFWNNIWTTRPLRIRVTTRSLTNVGNSGSGAIRTKDLFKNANMTIHNSGSGKIEMNLDADMLDMGMSGSGDILVTGSAKQLDCNISGSGRVRGTDLAVQDHSDIHISGSGSCTIATNGEISGRISGSGGIYYKGDPGSVNITHSGSGRAHRID